MRLVWIITLAAATATVNAQQPAEKTFTSASDVTAMIAKAKSERKPDQANFIQTLLQASPYKVNLEYRVRGVDTNPNVHEHEAELVYVVEGGGTLTTGGKLRDPKRANAANLTGSGIEGGDPRPIAKGDFVMIPENTAHGFHATSDNLVIMSIHLPRGDAAKVSAAK